jgi:hypothetical protein
VQLVQVLARLCERRREEARVFRMRTDTQIQKEREEKKREQGCSVW